ncbi:MAG: hypothetical protein RIT27_1444 [Pseudomonadota bacterium]|jgi:hypothetical protein
MKLEAIINEQGVLTTHFPKSLWGKKVLISVQQIHEKPVKTENILDVFAEADKLTFHRRSHEEILEELHILRANK